MVLSMNNKAINRTCAGTGFLLISFITFAIDADGGPGIGQGLNSASLGAADREAEKRLTRRGYRYYLMPDENSTPAPSSALSATIRRAQRMGATAPAISSAGHRPAQLSNVRRLALRHGF